MEVGRKNPEWHKRLFLSRETWDALNETERQFILEAHEGYFSYEYRFGGVLAWGIAGLGDKFSMKVDSKELNKVTLYWPNQDEAA